MGDNPIRRVDTASDNMGDNPISRADTASATKGANPIRRTDIASDTSGIGSEYNSDEDEDIDQLRLLVEITTGRRIFPVTQERAKTFHAPEKEKSKKTKRKKRMIQISELNKSQKHEMNKHEADQNVEKRAARVSAKFREVEIRSADAAGRTAKHKKM